VIPANSKLQEDANRFWMYNKYEKIETILNENSTNTIFCVEEYGNCYNKSGQCVDQTGNSVKCNEIKNKDLGVTSQIILNLMNSDYSISAYASNLATGINSDYLYMLCMTFENEEYEYMFWHRDSLSEMSYYEITAKSLVSKCVYRMNSNEYRSCTPDEVVEIKEIIKHGDESIVKIGLTHKELEIYFSVWYEEYVKPIKWEAIRK